MMRSEEKGYRDQYRDHPRYNYNAADDRNRKNDRDWWDRASDEVSSWFGDEQAQRRRRRDSVKEGEFYDTSDHRSRSTIGYNDREFARARDVMSRDVVRVHPQDSLQYAARLMAGYDCGALPVVDRNERLIGMVTDRDIAVRGVAERSDAGRLPVRATMTDEAFACNVNDSLKDCMRAMAEHQIRRLPIVDGHGRVVGIVSQADIAQHAGNHTGTGERKAVADVVCAISEPSDRPYRH